MAVTTEDEKKRIRNIQDDFTSVIKYMKDVAAINDTVAGLFIKIGRKLVEGRKFSEALGIFRLALDYYSTKNFNGGECLNELGLIYLEMAKAYKSKNQPIKAFLLLYLA
jgi:hypothetical protein